ncbi:MAG: hypothetical protein KKD56_12980 [Acidobacteria bacterium]|nr:hypothetical protein [Acidobacteriota bacterium]MBU4330776.1 hypothetical protein [Acidobacteriota bacterium]MCG2816141.1 DUF6206 family protein [Candidatus Aminicenantes bacterium]
MLTVFEQGLRPHRPEASDPPPVILGYGEISSIFQIGNEDLIAYKRMPLFRDVSSAETYIGQYREYCELLREAGLHLPEDGTAIVDIPGRPVVLYIGQRLLPPERFGHKLIHTLDPAAARLLIEKAAAAINRIWEFNKESKPALELAIDGQISNWVWLDDDPGSPLVYVDTSTPLFRKKGEIQLDPELFLQSAPSFLRWIIRRLFLEDVMTRYFIARQVYTDLAANLYKEQRPELIPGALEGINRFLPKDEAPLTAKEVEKYYKEDKTIWKVFLAFRRFDRWLKTKISRRRYEFILPGKIKR